MQDFRKSVVYQIYPKSFLDTNGDGLGELKGVTTKLDYLKKLGVDYLWLTPFFVSPQKDNGYDVADYRNIDPRYGTMADFEELSREAERRGIGLMLDMARVVPKSPGRGPQIQGLLYLEEGQARRRPAHQLGEQIRRQCLGIRLPV